MIIQPDSLDTSVLEEYRPWLALKVRIRSEKTAVAALRDRGFQPFVPSVHRRRNYSDRTRVVESPVFPGYVFCQCGSRKKSELLDSATVDYIVSFGGKPAEVPEREIESVRAVLLMGGRAFPYFSAGALVKIKHGPLAGIEGLIMRQGKQHDFVVSINLLQRSVAVAIDEEYLSI